MAGSVRVWLVGMVTFMVLDGVWLGAAMRRFYTGALRPIARLTADGSLDFNWAAAVPVYVCLIAGLALFVLPRADGTIVSAAKWGAIFGLATYGVYDLTNMAILRDYPLRLVLVDMAWGAVASAATAAVMQGLGRG